VVSEAPSTLRRLRGAVTAPRAAGVAGILSALLLTAAILLLRSGLGGPPTLQTLTAGSGAIDPDQLRLGLSLMPYVAMTFIWFMGVVRMNFSDPANQLFGTVFLATGVLLLATLLVATGLASGVVELREQDLEGRSAAAWLGGAGVFELLFGVAPRMAGGFILITANLLRRVRIMPQWMAVLSVALGLLLLFGVRRIDWTVFSMPAWVAMVSLLILSRERDVRADPDIAPFPQTRLPHQDDA
jgi:hypothetical protein